MYLTTYNIYIYIHHPLWGTPMEIPICGILLGSWDESSSKVEDMTSAGAGGAFYEPTMAAGQSDAASTAGRSIFFF